MCNKELWRNGDYYVDQNGTGHIPNGVTKIEKNAFRGCSGLASVTIPDSVIKIGDCAFRDCSCLTSVTIPDSVTEIGHCAFDSCSGLSSVTIPNSVTKVGNWAFYGCSGLTNITIPDSVTEIGDSAFDGCSELTSINIPDGVTKIGYRAFDDCSGLTNINIPDSVTEIGDGAFRDCSGLTSITIPNSVTEIGAWAFDGCFGLTSIHYKGRNIPVKCIDSDCMEIISQKQMGETTIYKTRYFGEDEIVYVAERDNLAAHGNSIREAIEDLEFKFASQKDAQEHVARIKKQGFMTAMDYRLLTRSCRPGVQRFLDKKGLTWEDKLPLDEVMTLVKGEYASELFYKLMS